MNDEAVYRTAEATPGLLIICLCSQKLEEMHLNMLHYTILKIFISRLIEKYLFNIIKKTGPLIILKKLYDFHFF